MGWEHLYQSWKLKLPTTLKEENVKTIDQCVEVIIQPTIDFLRDSCTEYAKT